ncbi:MAG TPA: ankyrin repeat domain-containing protein [Kofleriaceae bacterium]
MTEPVDAVLAKIALAVPREVPALIAELRRLDAVDRLFKVPPVGARLPWLVALVALMDPAGAAAARVVLDDPDPEVRVAALVAITALDPADHIEAIQSAVNDIDPTVRTAARDALGHLKIPPAYTEKDRALLQRAQNPLELATKADEISQLLRDGANVHAVGWGGQTALLAACANGSLAAVDVLLAAGARLDAVDDHGAGVLHHATSYPGPREDIVATLLPERRAIIARLLALGVNRARPDQQGRTPLWWAAAYLDRASCELLIDGDLALPLAIAVEHGNLDTATLLLERGAVATADLVESAQENHHARLAAELRRRAGIDDPAAADPRAALLALAERLGHEAAESAANSGDLDRYQRQEDLDPDDLVSEYWDGNYAAIVIEAIGALPDDAEVPVEVLDELYDTYAAAFRAPV